LPQTGAVFALDEIPIADPTLVGIPLLIPR